MYVLTNNPLVKQTLEARELCRVDYRQAGYRDILCLARDAVHKGHRLLTHPLSGSVKPNETPYKSIALSVRAEGMELSELLLIEQCIQTFDKFPVNPKYQNLSGAVRADFQTVDLSLILSIF